MTFNELYGLIEENNQNVVKLYHGTDSSRLESILKNGLVSKKEDSKNVSCYSHLQKLGIRSNWVRATNNKIHALKFSCDVGSMGDPVLIVLYADPQETINLLENELKNIDNEEGMKIIKRYMEQVKNGDYTELIFDRIPKENIKGVAVYKNGNVETVYGGINSETKKTMKHFLHK